MKIAAVLFATLAIATASFDTRDLTMRLEDPEEEGDLGCEWSGVEWSRHACYKKWLDTVLTCACSLYFRFDAVDKGVDFDKAMEKIAKDAEK